ncbi:hypothetical protein [Limnoglobus roseus]|uniref:Uncharacterized protein n=1 Tax=Limnoglobus roseus TaxID=2598579 RepID=A0A5C1AMR6_9BACT|nr:hypothetical protein [Limnoglobus roseus]QEL18494.1 hypothetical protein PX52LOC_05519 [Limnoglobus roseus]
MVAAVRCPNPKCRKFMLVEDTDQGNVVACLICKQAIKVPAAPGKAPPTAPPVAPAVLTKPGTGEDLMPIFDDDEPQFKVD